MQGRRVRKSTAESGDSSEVHAGIPSFISILHGRPFMSGMETVAQPSLTKCRKVGKANRWVPSCFWRPFFGDLFWESAKVSHKRAFALSTPEKRQLDMAEMLQKPVFALPRCQPISVNTLLCDTLGLAACTFCHFSMADCVKPSPPSISPRFEGIGGLRVN